MLTINIFRIRIVNIINRIIKVVNNFNSLQIVSHDWKNKIIYVHKDCWRTLQTEDSTEDIKMRYQLDSKKKRLGKFVPYLKVEYNNLMN